MSPLPRFSVIVPAYEVQAYLHECLDSVLSQSCPDLELIVVDDSSPDACGAIAEEYAARDPRVRTVRLPDNTGPGPARNAGLREATGDYVVFLDGDDTLAPDALQAVSDRLKETEEPDVLVYGHARALWTGDTVRDGRAYPLTECGPAPFRLTDRPALLTVLTAVWNKAYRREFLQQEGFAFPPGLYESTPWTYPVLMTARSLATLDRVCVHHRERRRVGPSAAPSPRHFDVFDQYDRLFAYVDARPELACWRPVLFRRMVDHLAAVFHRRGRLPSGTHAEFLRRARAHCARYRTPGGVHGHRRRLRHLLIGLGSHRTYRMLSLASRLRRHAGRSLRLLLRGGWRAALRVHYRVQRLLPVRADHAVFSSHGGLGHGCNPGALENAFRTLLPGMRTAWVARPEFHHTLPTATRRVTPGSAAYWTALARSKYLVANTALDPRLVKRRGQVVVQTQAGTPLKRMGLDLRERPATGGADAARLVRDADRWDYVLSGNRHSTLVWERVHPAGYETLEYGLPRNDVFQRATSLDVARARASLGIPDGAIALLYAPTHRDYRRTQRTSLDLERLLRELGPRYVLLSRARPGEDGPPLTVAGGRLLDVSGHPNVQQLCLASDALITDYSSLMFDYAGLDRPIVIHADDWDAYEAARGTYFDVRAFPPGAVARGTDELIDIFVTGHWRGSRSTELRAAFRERFCPHDDGRAAERVVRRVVLGESPESLPAPVPLAERSPVPSAAALFGTGRADLPAARSGADPLGTRTLAAAAPSPAPR